MKEIVVGNQVPFIVKRVLKNHERAHYITANQPPMLLFEIQCDLCKGGVSNPSVVFLNERHYKIAIGLYSQEELEILLRFMHYAGGAEGRIELVGGCMKCGNRLFATSLFVHH